MNKFVYMFNEGNAKMRNLLGGKGANLAEMTNLGLPVPHGFTVSTEACLKYLEEEQLTADMEEQIEKALLKLQEVSGKILGDKENPLLVSVRSGAPASMPGMMDTVLDLGLNAEVAEGLAKLTDNPRFAYDSYRRFIMMFADVVMGLDIAKFEEIMADLKTKRGVEDDTQLNEDDLKEVTRRSLEVYEELKGEPFPVDPKVQLFEAIEAVFRSWNNPRAVYYRLIHNIPGDWGTAVNVQEMVYGNMGDDSGSGVAFSRNPATGENKVYGEYLVNAQGEDVVAGIRTPVNFEKMQEWNPEIYEEFVDIAKRLEKHYGDMQDLEFTIEKGKLFLLQTRDGKRTAMAAMQVAVDMVEEGLITKERAIKKMDPATMDALLHPMFVPEALAEAKAVAKGLPASPGAACGKIVFTAEAARIAHDKGEKVILVRTETSPEDIEGMNVAQGILTARGGMTSHAAVVARGMGKCCVSGCPELLIYENEGKMQAGSQVLKVGDLISLDGSTGYVYPGEIATKPAEISGNFSKVIAWANEIRKMNVRTNADTAKDARRALDLGAGGIGLTRTEHMFFEKDRIFEFRKMILAENEEGRREALSKILPMQKEDFVGLFRVMDGLPVNIRLLDPPLHEFLPSREDEKLELAEGMKMPVEELNEIIDNLAETNPMLGMRGCRLALFYPEIAEMQVEAIISAALEVKKEGISVHPEIMVPLVADAKELEYLKKLCVRVADKLIEESGVELSYLVGTMLEIPRAALTADEVAQFADFFSFGTNDLTQMGYGLSRDDAGKVLDVYYKKGIFDSDPTAVLDLKGIGRLMRIASTEGRVAKPSLHLGICGEHGGEPKSIELCHELNFDYVSCSPYRVPIAILAAAQAEIKAPRGYNSLDFIEFGKVEIKVE